MAVQTKKPTIIKPPAVKSAPSKAVKVKTKSAPKATAPYNQKTMKVIRDALAGKNLLRYPSAEAMYKDLGMRKRGEK
jgi:hypothetical protein